MEQNRKNSILIVDDEKANILELMQILSPMYAVYVSRNGRDAIEAVREAPVDIIMLNILMPDMGAYAVIEALKSSGETSGIPVIFITGLSGDNEEKKGLRLGAADYIPKPFTPAIVKLRVQNQMKIVNNFRIIAEREADVKCCRAKNETLSRITGGMRAPICDVIKTAQSARTASDPEKRKEYLLELELSSNSLSGLIENVLEICATENDVFAL